MGKQDAVEVDSSLRFMEGLGVGGRASRGKV